MVSEHWMRVNDVFRGWTVMGSATGTDSLNHKQETGRTNWLHLGSNRMFPLEPSWKWIRVQAAGKGSQLGWIWLHSISCSTARLVSNQQKDSGLLRCPQGNWMGVWWGLGNSCLPVLGEALRPCFPKPTARGRGDLSHQLWECLGVSGLHPAEWNRWLW